MSTTISTTVYNWLREMKIPVSKTYIRHQLNSHPDYPSLLSISDTLDELGIENTAVQIEKEQLAELPLPFIAHLNGNGGEFVMVDRIDNPERKFPGFFKRWDGVVIAAEKPKQWQHKQNNELLAKDNNKRFAVATALTLLSAFIILSAVICFSWIQIGLLLIATAGIFVSWMIISRDLSIENKMADQVCGKEADCNTVIHSEVAKLPFGIGWSDAGIIYFSFLLIALLIASFNDMLLDIYKLIAIMASAAIPIMIISVYYQWRVIKKWCRLCLVTVALLWLQLILLMPTIVNILKNGFSNSIINATVTSVLLLVTMAAAWLGLKPLIKKNKETQSENFAATRFRRNADIFKALLEKQKKITVNPDGLGITIGNPAATNTIIKVCNPYCGPCATAHPVIEKLLEQNDNLKVQIIFNADDDQKDIRAKPVKHLMALYEKSSGQLIEQALDDWYMADEKDYEVFAMKYVLNGELEKQGDKLQAMKSWYNEVKIEFTPTFFINGYQLPKQYTIEELKYFLEK